ncbi:MAG: hypothetical protein CVV27_16870 [Candidatus Melainabacteria bacterium HGW-Melainabacteria-1]|nr:MAG: hypothetical protein CVV27_16870 [Candidatus Melainabacteria bacterium HGW-Melainabacteria-1]
MHAQPNDYLTRPAIYKDLLTPEECLKIRGGPFANSSEARVMLDAAAGEAVDVSMRKTIHHSLFPGPQSDWIAQRIRQLFELTNQSYYHFKLSGFSELLVLEYELGGFYDWHHDLGQGRLSTRKLSCVVFLSDPADYAGGRLQLERPERDLPRNQGLAIVFPSYLNHRVEPLSAGRRWSLVAWAHGDAFT